MKIKVKRPTTNKAITTTTATITRVFPVLNIHPLVNATVSVTFTHH